MVGGRGCGLRVPCLLAVRFGLVQGSNEVPPSNVAEVVV